MKMLLLAVALAAGNGTGPASESRPSRPGMSQPSPSPSPSGGVEPKAPANASNQRGDHAFLGAGRVQKPFEGEAAVRDTTWGMTLEQVRKLHPGGIEALVEEDKVYHLVAPALDLPKVVVAFFFNSREGLWMVSFTCPGKDGKVDPVTGDVSRMKKTDARAMRSALRDRLAAQLGAPTFEVEGSDMAIRWDLPEAMIAILLPRSPQRPDEAAVSITYSKARSPAP